MAVRKAATGSGRRFVPVTKLAGMVSTSGTTGVVVWQSGDKFTPEVAGKQITISGAVYSINTYTSATQVVVTPNPPAHASAAYAVEFIAVSNQQTEEIV